MKMIAYAGAIMLPIAVPLVCNIQTNVTDSTPMRKEIEVFESSGCFIGLMCRNYALFLS